MGQGVVKVLAAISLALIPLAPSDAQTPQKADAEDLHDLDPRAISAAHQLLDIITPPATRQAKLAERFKFIADQTPATYATMPSSKDPKFNELVDKNMDEMWQGMVAVMGQHMPALYDAMARAYARKFSAAELGEILAFAKTPAGLKFLQSGNLIAQDVDVVGVQQQMLTDLTSELPTIKKKTDAAIASYVANKSKANPN
ncbi:MAG: DUF2059 domain-containing protein [Novosphingobium sp.]